MFSTTTNKDQKIKENHPFVVNVTHLFVQTFFLLMLVVPTVFQLQRGIFLAVLCAIGVIAAMHDWRVSRDVFVVWLVTIVAGAFFILWGYINSAPGALKVSTVYLFWPTLYMLFIGLATPKLIISLIRVVVLGIAIVSAMLLVLLGGGVAGYAPTVIDWFSFQGAGIGIYDGYIELTTYNLTTLIYGLPFLVAMLLFDRRSEVLKKRWWLWFLLAVVLLMCLFSGRRAFWLIALVAPLIVGGLALAIGGPVPKRILFGVGITAVLGFFSLLFTNISYVAIINQFVSAFSPQENSAGLRYEQWNAMVQSFIDSPLIGQGLGTSLKTVIRSEDIPWAYELSYGALLFQTGLLGLIVYSAAILWVFVAGIRLARSNPLSIPIIMPLLAGLAGFLLANATNPYLSKFDYLWTIFLPVAAINAYRMRAA